MATTDGIRSTKTSFTLIAVPSPTVGGSGTTRSVVKASSVVFYYSRPSSGYKLFCVLCFTCFLFNARVTCLIFVIWEDSNQCTVQPADDAVRKFKSTYVMSRDVFMFVPSLELVEPVLWEIITKHSEMEKKYKIILFKLVALYFSEK